MFKPLVTHVLQHITSQNNWAKPHLAPFAGRTIAFDFSVIKANLLILEDGSLCAAGETSTIDATVHIPPSLAMRLLAKDDAAKSYIKIDGDVHLATEVSKVLQLMRWDVEEDLSKVVGDIAAFKIGEVSKATFQEAKKQTINAAEMLSEYWQEEKNILAKKRHIEQFINDVDKLRNDVNRFDKRLEKIINSIAEKTKVTSEKKRTPKAKSSLESPEK
jgi:ubiquinone biosynthesis accessory factor UbiJ